MSCFITMPQKELRPLEVIRKIRDERLSVVVIKIREATAASAESSYTRHRS
jgi:hypothetical protein